MKSNSSSQYVSAINKIDRRADTVAIVILGAMFLSSWAANQYGNWALGGLAFIAGAVFIVHIQTRSIGQIADLMVNNLPNDRYSELMRWIEDNPHADLLNWPGWKTGIRATQGALKS